MEPKGAEMNVLAIINTHHYEFSYWVSILESFVSIQKASGRET
jgi:hypothetical protein